MHAATVDRRGTGALGPARLRGEAERQAGGGARRTFHRFRDRVAANRTRCRSALTRVPDGERVPIPDPGHLGSHSK